jgi:serine/threonine-protein kinase
MISRAGVVKVMDFGTARVGAGQANTTATAVIGEAHYLSPEQINGGVIDARSDIYAVGCVLYELLCGRPPFTGASPVAIAHQHVREVARPPSDFAAGVPRQLDAVTLKAMSKNPMNRYQGAAEMRTDLLRALAGQPVAATPLLREKRPAPAPETRALVGATAGHTGSTPLSNRPPGANSGPALLAPVQTLPQTDPDDGPTPDDTAITRRRMRLAALVAVGAAVVVALWLTLMVVTAPPVTPKVSVPDLSGMTLEQAQATLRDKQLTLGTVAEVDSPKASAGRVVNQRPSELTQVDESTPVNVEIDTS